MQSKSKIFNRIYRCNGSCCRFLTYTRVTFKFAPQVKRQLEFKEFRHKKNQYAVKGNLLGDENAKVVVNVYSDYQCPICPVHNVMMHKLAKEMKNVKIVHRNYPLDTECNPYLQAPFHVGSCVDARYSVAAEKQGRLWEMNEILFENKPQTEEAILKLAKKQNLTLKNFKKMQTALKLLKKLKQILILLLTKA